MIVLSGAQTPPPTNLCDITIDYGLAAAGSVVDCTVYSLPPPAHWPAGICNFDCVLFFALSPFAGRSAFSRRMATVVLGIILFSRSRIAVTLMFRLGWVAWRFGEFDGSDYSATDDYLVYGRVVCRVVFSLLTAEPCAQTECVCFRLCGLLVTPCLFSCYVKWTCTSEEFRLASLSALLSIRRQMLRPDRTPAFCSASSACTLYRSFFLSRRHLSGLPRCMVHSVLKQ